MSPPDPVPRWDDVRSELLDELVARTHPTEYYGFRPELLAACAAIVSASADTDMVFVGRSGEHAYDLLHALLRGTRWAGRVRLLPFAMREGSVATLSPQSRADIERHLQDAGLAPDATFVDCVAWGTTFGNLCQLLGDRARFLGLTLQSEGWTHWKYDRVFGGRRLFSEGRAAVMPIPARLWFALAERQPKTSESHTPECWSEGPQHARLDRRGARALRISVDLRGFGMDDDVRRDFARQLARGPAGRERWLRSLVVDLHKTVRKRLGFARKWRGD